LTHTVDGASHRIGPQCLPIGEFCRFAAELPATVSWNRLQRQLARKPVNGG